MTGDGIVRHDEGETPAIRGRDLLGIVLDAGGGIAYLCMAGACGTCRVRVVAGADALEPPTAAEFALLGPRCGPERLACQAICRGGDVTVTQRD